MGNVVLRPTRIPNRVPPKVEKPNRKRNKGGKKFLRGAIVILGSMALTTVAIKANDIFNVPRDGMIGGVGASVKESRCIPGMVYVSDSEGGFCIDAYEASPGKLCPNQSPSNQFETNANLAQPLCTPISVAGATPWVNIPQVQAMELCARLGKHLAKNSEWYGAALGTPDTASGDGSCVLGLVGVSKAEKTGTRASCVSSFGAYDMVGNVWEWVDGTVSDGKFGERYLPHEGYVAETDTDGIPVATASSSNQVFHQDYFFLDAVGVKGMFRGGFWNMTDKAGVNTLNVASPSTFIGSAVGFRCAR